MRLAGATDREEFMDMLKYQIGELEIPGIMLALEENMTADLASVSLELVHPEPFPGASEELPIKIPDRSFIPHKYFPQNRRHAMMLEILHHGDKYIGFTLLEMGRNDPAWFDTIRALLSQSLYSIYSREGRIAGRRSLLNKSDISEIIKGRPMEDTEPGRVGTKEIIAYLMDHLDEMTDLEKMCRDLGISKSHLIRQSKALTGFPVRILHEQLKVEQAKKLMLAGNIKLSEISARLGFQSQSYFSAVFRKVTGVSPRDWMRK
jgi:AraC-like DNA-binding protein